MERLVLRWVVLLGAPLARNWTQRTPARPLSLWMPPYSHRTKR